MTRQANIKFPARLMLHFLAVYFAMIFAGAAKAMDTLNRMQSNPLVQQAMLDLAQRESVAVGEISLESFEEVVWPDTSMGCPRPGMQYTQVPQDGSRIVLRVKGKLREYHSGGNRAPFPCTFISQKR